MSRTRIKFCGITRGEDVRCALELGVDAIGLVLTRKSRRFVEPSSARVLRALLPPFVSAVALLMDDDPEWVEQVIQVVRPDLLQFHGSEDAAFAERLDYPYLKAVPMASVDDVPAYARAHPRAAGFLLDSHAVGAVGGTGAAFDWTRVPRNLDRPLVLAGGLDAGNVAAAITQAQPYAVDVSSGIESEPGIKDPQRMRAFVAAVRAAGS
ncbi:phosphoribosylanthranilate isomerase [Dokdonella sp.]|uniref:phosphoribosylanthranilate isomerase n=1 Tax=Dokdonella sp. TaxID=2291710 RepID=UPI0025BA0F2D|nr:phosphoribosylanthranilate isomerase [Dokdonella sp.]MBX3689031.1 phosphoribosylanthranilate isomerase [Dokdonella sp.]